MTMINATSAGFPRLFHTPRSGWLAAVRAARRQRLALRNLDDTRLDDLGLTREQARREAGRPFWDVPRHWLR
jgi:uncharacterized protein YjiS (DUF1127 family)